ncbi:MAG: CapA family protein [Eubacteriales bacterium]
MRNKFVIRFALFSTIIVMMCITAYVLFTNVFGGAPIEAELSVNRVPQKDLFQTVFSYPSGEAVGKKERITISANGDIMFHTPQINAAYKDGSYSFDENFVKIKKYIENADIALGNFESTTNGGTPSGYPIFNAPDEALTTLSQVGYDVLSTANNHCLDSGKSGIIRTIEKINENNMVNIGTYTDPGEHIYITDVKGVKLAILAYTYGLNGMDSLLTNNEREDMINLIREDKIQDDISRSKELGADMTIVFIHWGNEYQLNPSWEQTQLAQQMFDWGADIILGSHPHVVQKSELLSVDGEMKYVIYSMGNLISNQRRETLGGISNSEYTEDGVIVNITLEKDVIKNHTKIVSIKYIPTWVDRQVAEGGFKYEVLPVSNVENENVSTSIANKMRQSFSNTMTKMTSYRDFGD